MLPELDIVVYNPRREHFDINKDNANEQVQWEQDMLNISSIISFWFSSETVQPIVLYELGTYFQKYSTKILIGIDPNYPRRKDVETQILLENKINRPIVYSLEELAFQIKQNVKELLQ